MINTAKKYAETGWAVFPLQPRMKIPYPGSRGKSEATTDLKLIEAWWTRYPQANIGIACGEISGIWVIDVDVKKQNGFESCPELKAFIGKTLTQLTPSGGMHFIFKCEEGKTPRSKINFKPGVDIISNGYYILGTPSIHPSGLPYEWMNEGAELLEFPEEFKPKAKAVALPWGNVSTTTSMAPDQIRNRAIQYLDKCPPAVQGSGGHNALLWAARAMVSGFQLSVPEAIDLLWSHYNPRCSPPWDYNNGRERKDFERKAQEAHDTPSTKPPGWLLTEKGIHEEMLEQLHSEGAKIAEAILASPKKRIEKQVDLQEDINEWPESLLRPEGLVGDICDWINGSAGCYQPVLTLGAALCACGALFGRKVRDISNGRTNLYAIGVAESSAGKDHPATCLRELFNAAGATYMLSGQVTSDSAIELSLMEHPIKMFFWDEIGFVFDAIKGAGIGGNAHLKTIAPSLMELYSSAQKLYLGKQKAEGSARRIDQPHVCLWGMTSPSIFYRAISHAELESGWLGRVLTFISLTSPKYVMREYSPPPKALVEMVRAWYSREIPPPPDSGDVDAVMRANQMVVRNTDDATDVFNKFKDECYDKRLELKGESDSTRYLWGKALEIARRISLIVSVGRQWDNPEISKEDALYGCAVVRRCILCFTEAIEANMANSIWESEKQKFYEIISNAGVSGIAKAEFTRKTQWVKDKMARDNLLEDMQEAGRIVVAMHPEKSRSWIWSRKHAETYYITRNS